MTHPVLHLKTAVSTQTRARRLAAAGAPAWTLVRADRQTGGRGRMDRHWSSGKGGLYFSLILRPDFGPRRLAQMSLAVGRLLARTITDATGLKTRVKPPNDVLARVDAAAPYRKVCGVLIEATGGERRLDWIVIGIGVNVNNRVPTHLTRATSLKVLAGRSFDTDALLQDILRGLRRKFA